MYLFDLVINLKTIVMERILRYVYTFILAVCMTACAILILLHKDHYWVFVYVGGLCGFLICCINTVKKKDKRE